MPGRRILFIDDDRDLTCALSQLLRNAGYDVRCASDGDEGLRMAQQEAPDLILLDYMMPGKDGFCACQEVRSLPALRDVPIIVLTAYGRNVGEIHGLPLSGAATHAHDYLEKPVEPNVLLDRIERALSSGLPR